MTAAIAIFDQERVLREFFRDNPFNDLDGMILSTAASPYAESMQRETCLIEAEALANLLGEANLKLLDASVEFSRSNPSAKANYLKAHIPGAAFF